VPPADLQRGVAGTRIEQLRSRVARQDINLEFVDVNGQNKATIIL